MPNFLDEIKKDAFGSHLNIQIESIGNAGALGFMTALPEHLNLGGRIHGGVLMAFADVVAAHATVLKLPAGSCTTTIESKTNFIRSAGLVKINAKAVPIHVGRTTMVWQTTVSDESGSTLAIVMQTQLVLKGVMTIEDWEEIKQKVEYEYAQDQYFQEMKQAENIRNRIDVLNQMAPYVGTYFSKEYVRKSVLRFSDDDIDRIEKENEDDPVEVQPQDQPGSDQAAALSRENVR